MAEFPVASTILQWAGNLFLRPSIRAAAYLLGGQGVSQFIRLAANLVLTRLLAPELFGLMAIVNVVVMAVGLFTDIGTGPAVIRSTRSMDQEFLDTAWTIQVCRGTGLWLLTMMVSYPAAVIYGKPLLVQLLPAVGLSFFIGAFNSMALITLRKELRQDRVVMLSLVTQLVSIVSMILLAWIFRSIWALVIGNVIGAITRLLGSYRLDTAIRHRFTLNREMARELLHYGKWIFLSTMVMFLATQTDRLLLGKLFPLALFGVYSIALGFAELPKNIANMIGAEIIFPLISLNQELPPAKLREKILGKRRLVLAGLVVAVALFAGFSDYLITFLYDSRYWEAGWMLPLLALGMWPLLLIVTSDPVLYVVDRPVYPALGNCCKFVYMVVALPLACLYSGKLAALAVIACNDIPMYLVVGYGLRKKGFSVLRQDLLMTFSLLIVLLAIIFLRYTLGMGLPGGHLYH